MKSMPKNLKQKIKEEIKEVKKFRKDKEKEAMQELICFGLGIASATRPDLAEKFEEAIKRFKIV